MGPRGTVRRIPVHRNGKTRDRRSRDFTSTRTLLYSFTHVLRPVFRTTHLRDEANTIATEKGCKTCGGEDPDRCADGTKRERRQPRRNRTPERTKGHPTVRDTQTPSVEPRRVTHRDEDFEEGRKGLQFTPRYSRPLLHLMEPVSLLFWFVAGDSPPGDHGEGTPTTLGSDSESKG